MPKKQKPHFQRVNRVRKRRLLRDALNFAGLFTTLVVSIVVVALLVSCS